MRVQFLLVLQCNQEAFGSVTLCLPLGSLTVNQLHWLDITKYYLLLAQGIGIFHSLVEWISCPSYRWVVQLMVEWHTDYLRHRWLGHLDMVGVAFFVICAWIAWEILWHSLAWICGLVFSCSPNQSWCQCIIVHTILLSQCNFNQWCSWGLLHVPCPLIWLQNIPWRVWTVLVSNRVFKKRGPTCSVGILSCWVSFPEDHWLITLLAVNRTWCNWLGCVLIPCHILFPWVYICWWSHRVCTWCWCECITVVWGGSWGKNSRCPWSWTWRFCGDYTI